MSSKTSIPALDENPGVTAVGGKAFSGARGTAGVARTALGDVTNRSSSTAAPQVSKARPSSAAPTAPSTSTSVAPSTAASSSTRPASAATAGSGAGTSASAPAASDPASLERAIADVVAADKANPNRVADYINSIMRYHYSEEGRKAPSAVYMSRQSDITAKMRGILIDWLVEVHLKFKMMPETLFLTVSIIDRFLEKKSLARQKLQLLGVTAMFLAAKYEEIYSPELEDMVFITDRAYTREDILRMEGTVLQTLDFQLTVPTPFVFLSRFLKVSKADTRTTHLAHYYTERMLQEYTMLKHLPSAIAASAVCLAHKAVSRSSWTPLLKHYSGYSERSLAPSVAEMHSLLSAAPSSSLQSVRKKYSSGKLGEVSRMPLPRLPSA